MYNIKNIALHSDCSTFLDLNTMLVPDLSDEKIYLLYISDSKKLCDLSFDYILKVWTFSEKATKI